MNEKMMRRSWQSYLLNGLFRVVSKRRFPTEPDIAAIRSTYERLDAKRFRVHPDTVKTPVQTNGVSSDWVNVPASRDERVIYYLHGGGFMLRFPNAHTGMVARWCRRLGSRALMPDYRLAPEHPYPAAPQDCLNGYRWLLDQQIDPANIVIAGDSAGGCLSLATLHLIKEAGLPMPACAVLLSPGTDLTMSGKSVVTNERKDPMFMLQGLIIMRGSYAPEQFMAEPAASPLFADYEGFPPLHFVVGSTEILLDDSTRAVEKARRAGVETELRIWRGMPHVFPSFPFLPEARGATDDIVRFISRNTAWEEMPD